MLRNLNQCFAACETSTSAHAFRRNIICDHRVRAGIAASMIWLAPLMGVVGQSGVASPEKTPLDKQIGQQVDIASSAYVYRSDRPAHANPPESWVLLMQFAGLPYEKPVDTQAPAIKRTLCGLLWEEVRPVREVELAWP